MKEVPDLERRAAELAMRIDPQRRLGAVAVGATVYEAAAAAKIATLAPSFAFAFAGIADRFSG